MVFIPDLPPFDRKHLLGNFRKAEGLCQPAFETPPERLLFQSGRAAMVWGLKRLREAGARRVLLPAFFCNTVMEALCTVDLPLIYYDVDDKLGPGPALRIIGPGDAVIVVHYFGIPANLSEIVEACRERAAFLIEDCAHATPLAKLADFGGAGNMSIYSFRKQLPVPDGGLLTINSQIPVMMNASPGSLKVRNVSWKKMALLVIEALAFQSSINLYPMKAALRRRLGSTDSGFKADARFAGRLVSGCTCAVTADFDWNKAAGQRRENYRYLVGRLRGAKGICVPFPRIPENAIPQVLPVHTGASKELAERLQRIGIGATKWPGAEALHGLDYRRFPTSDKWTDRNLLLPVHEQLSKDALDQVVESLLQESRKLEL